MSRQEDFDKQSDEYVDRRKSFGLNDPYALKEIGEAYYQGCEHGYQYAFEKACEWLAKQDLFYADLLHDVIPDTIGQFTGLVDKNDKEIYEGDIVTDGISKYICCFVEGGFGFRDLSDDRLVLKAIVNRSYIIGNIHDNPELLKGGKSVEK